MNTLKQITDLVDDFNNKKQILVEKLREEIGPLISTELKNSKYINSVGWRQYTPYFNDGETCEFSAHLDDLYFNGYSEYDDVDEDEEEFTLNGKYNYVILNTEEDVLENNQIANIIGASYRKDKKIGEKGYKWVEGFDKSEIVVLENITKLLRSIPEEFLQEIFGDHALVTIHKDGTVDVEEYNHD